ncbi:MAG TPA: hypothetical protein VG916_05475 [Gemmatimonadaceae bacterium]|nr:hypothetical protein [Gemmatimonadaceae bacterium]
MTAIHAPAADQPAPRRRTYAAPVLVPLGTLADSTSAVNNTNKADGGRMAGMKRSG